MCNQVYRKRNRINYNMWFLLNGYQHLSPHRHRVPPLVHHPTTQRLPPWKFWYQSPICHHDRNQPHPSTPPLIRTTSRRTFPSQLLPKTLEPTLLQLLLLLPQLLRYQLLRKSIHRTSRHGIQPRYVHQRLPRRMLPIRLLRHERWPLYLLHGLPMVPHRHRHEHRRKRKKDVRSWSTIYRKFMVLPHSW